MKEGIIPIFVPHRGCKNQCVFCNQRAISGCVSDVTPDDVIEILNNELPKSGSYQCQAAFYGGSFTAIPKAQQEALLDACAPAINGKRLSGIRISTRPDCIDFETLNFLREKNVRTIELGVQSFDDKVLELSRRGHTAEDAVSAARQVKEAGFELILQIMAGMPGSDIKKDLDTAKTAASLRPDGVRIYPMCVFPKTELYSMWKNGEYSPLSVSDAAYITAKMLDIFDEAGIPVIRTGLNHSEDTASSVAAGPYHPAFGELARSCQNYLHICQKIEKMQKIPEELFIFTEKRKISQIIGHGRENIVKLKEKYGFSSVKVTDTRPAGETIYIEI